MIKLQQPSAQFGVTELISSPSGYRSASSHSLDTGARPSSGKAMPLALLPSRPVRGEKGEVTGQDACSKTQLLQLLCPHNTAGFRQEVAPWTS